MWSELLAVLLELILRKVGMIELLLCACVCKSRRLAVMALKQEFMATQGPLVFLMSTNPRKYRYFYNIFDKRLYRTSIPHLLGNRWLGFTCGYLVLRDAALTQYKADIWLVNPFTRPELKFPWQPKRYCHVMLASLAKSGSEFLIVVFSPVATILTVLQGKIYVLTNHGEIGTLNLSSDHTVTFLNAKKAHASRDESDLHLVVSHE
ncbi:hypothetical protein DITRI_Ditri09bG0013300 [Diplodiscus trichospermus]